MGGQSFSAPSPYHTSGHRNRGAMPTSVLESAGKFKFDCFFVCGLCMCGYAYRYGVCVAMYTDVEPEVDTRSLFLPLVFEQSPTEPGAHGFD